jgi:beta-glucosidase
LKLPRNTIKAGDPLKVEVTVTNTGRREGDEVVQLYTRDVVSSVTTYEKSLRGFQRVHLKPGETKTLAFTLTPDDLALWDRSMHFVVEPGKFKVMIGSGSEDIRSNGEFEIVVGPKRPR